MMNMNPTTKGLTIVDIDKLNTLDADTYFATVRLKSGKLVLMTKEDGDWKPFFVRGIEIGFWDDVRDADVKMDWDKAYADYADLNANTVLFMVHWKDFEEEDGVFDFSKVDADVAKIASYGLKCWFVLFTHNHYFPDRPILDTFWAFHLDEDEQENRGIQWIQLKDGTILKTIDAVKQHTEILPCYYHPEIFPRVNRLFHKVAEHYANSPTVIGAQLGNEECFASLLEDNYGPDLGWDSDFNPYTLKAFDTWKEETGKNSWHAFKLFSSGWWYRQFTTSYHEASPYQLASTNLLGGWAEANVDHWVHRMGCDPNFYREGNLDVIGIMFYADKAQKIWPNLDAHYDYLYNLPMVIPSEVGAGGSTFYVSEVQYLYHAIYVLERGGQGYSIYCYGNIMQEGFTKFNVCGERVARLYGIVKENEDILWSGIPGFRDIKVTCDNLQVRISPIANEDGDTFAIVYFPDEYPAVKEANRTAVTDLKLKVTSAFECNVHLYTFDDQDANLDCDSGEVNVAVKDLNKQSAVFLRIVKE